MRVLMFGWEYRPHVSGGLGTTCFGLKMEIFTRTSARIDPHTVPQLHGCGLRLHNDHQKKVCFITGTSGEATLRGNHSSL